MCRHQWALVKEHWSNSARDYYQCSLCGDIEKPNRKSGKIKRLSHTVQDEVKKRLDIA